MFVEIKIDTGEILSKMISKVCYVMYMLLTECEVMRSVLEDTARSSSDRAVSSSTDRKNSVNKLLIIRQKINKTRLQQFNTMNKAGKRLITPAKGQLFVARLA